MTSPGKHEGTSIIEVYGRQLDAPSNDRDGPTKSPIGDRLKTFHLETRKPYQTTCETKTFNSMFSGHGAQPKNTKQQASEPGTMSIPARVTSLSRGVAKTTERRKTTKLSHKCPSASSAPQVPTLRSTLSLSHSPTLALTHALTHATPGDGQKKKRACAPNALWAIHS